MDIISNNINTYYLKRKSTSLAVSVLRLCFIVGLCYLFLFPIYYLLVSAIQNPVTAKDPTIMWIPKDLSLSNLHDALSLLDYRHSFFLSSILTIVSTLGTLLSCAMVGYGFARFRFFESKIAFAMVLLIIIIPPQTTTISTFLNYRFFNFAGLLKLMEPVIHTDHINMLDTVWTFVLPSLFGSGIRAGLFIFIFRQFFLGQPKELEEAAKIDGCGYFTTFWRIMLRLAVPAIVTVTLFSFVWYWNDSFYSTLFFPDTEKPLAAQLVMMRDAFIADYTNKQHTATEQKGILAAGALLCVLPPLILYIFTQRYFTESIERTGIVG